MSAGQGHRSTAEADATRWASVARRVWIARLVFATTLALTWCFSSQAFATEMTVSKVVSSASMPAMSVRVDEPAHHDVRNDRAPLCDIRCATTFAPAPQFQDEEVSLAIGDDADDESPALDAVRALPGESASLDVSHAEPCTLAPPSVGAAPASALFAPIAAEASRGPNGVVSSVERPPRA